ncbi:hypothetical protein KAZ66_04990 [Candidatus Woesebacteria bacterium]|nr:hypothetical protein [Candidatus Woesebacteria bacterium]
MDTILARLRPYLKDLTASKIVLLVSSALAILSLTMLALPLFLIFAIIGLIAFLLIPRNNP